MYHVEVQYPVATGRRCKKLWWYNRIEEPSFLENIDIYYDNKPINHFKNTYIIYFIFL